MSVVSFIIGTFKNVEIKHALFYSLIGKNVKGLVGGVCTVQPRCRSASLPRSLGRSLICPPGPAGMPAWPPAFLMQEYDSAFRVWRILGGGP